MLISKGSFIAHEAISVNIAPYISFIAFIHYDECRDLCSSINLHTYICCAANARGSRTQDGNF